MWSALVKLIELLEKKVSESQQPRRRLAKAITALYSTLNTCHESYLAYRADSSRKSMKRWAAAIDSLVVTVASTHTTLDIFAPEVQAELERYMHSELRASGLFNPDSLIELGLGQISYAVGDQVDPTLTKPLQTNALDDDEDFACAMKKLGDFIRTNFKMEEIYGKT